jgi:hypothetical protein
MASTAARAVQPSLLRMPMRALATKVDMKLIKQLREMTGAPMADCKSALTESAEAEDVRFSDHDSPTIS